MRRSYRLVGSALALCASVAGAACGGGANEGSEAAWIKAADASCRRLQTSVGGQPPQDAANADANAEFWGALARGARVNLSEIDALQVPSDDADVVAEIVAGMRTTMDQLDLAVASYEAKNVGEAQAQLDEFFVRNEKTVGLFTDYGSKICGEA